MCLASRRPLMGPQERFSYSDQRGRDVVDARRAFRGVYRAYPDVAEALLRTLSISVRSLSLKVFEFNTLSAPDWVLVELLRPAESDGANLNANSSVDIPAPSRHEDIAKLKPQRETVTKEISRAQRWIAG